MLTAYLITEIGTIVYLRRYSKASGCRQNGGHYHNANVQVAVTDGPVTGYITIPEGKGEYADDPRWPTQCDACGTYQFLDADNWQVNVKRRYNTPSGRPEAGALFYTPWGENHLYGVTPSGELWDIDGAATNGPGWTRHGIPPVITVTPSVAAAGYHGFLQNGIWTDDLDGRIYQPRLSPPGM